MESIARDGTGLPLLLAYGFVILLYLIILRLLLNMIQQMGDKHLTQRSVVDRDIHKMMDNRVETSMHAFDVYTVALIIAKGGIAALFMAAIIVLLSVKVGILATAMLIAIVITMLWGVNHWLKSQEKTRSIRGEIQKYVQKSGSVGSILLLSIALATLLFALIVMHA